MTANLYEAMFVVDAAKGSSEFPNTIRHIADLLTRHGAEIERMERWDERKLAYPIGHAKRGVYILVYVRADGSAITEIRRSVVLSEDLLRVLILRSEGPSAVRGELYGPDGQPVPPEEVAAPAQAEKPATPEPPAEPEAGAKAEQPEPPEPSGEPEAGGESEQPEPPPAEEAEQEE